jgi:glycosyltransferase EpsD
VSTLAKKVLFCASVDYHFKAFHLPYMKWFQSQGWEVHVAAKGNIKLPFCDVRYDLPVERTPLKLGNLKAYKELKNIINSNDFSIIHVHTPMAGLLARLAARGARKKGARVIYTAHGFHFCNGGPLLNWLIYYPLERWLSHYTDCLITINSEDYNLAIGHRFKAGRIEHVHGVGINTERFKPLEESVKLGLRNKYGYKKEDFLIYYAAELNKNKNQGLLIKGIARVREKIPGIRLLLIGEGPLMKQYKDMAKKLGASDIVDFLGFRKEVDEIAQMCDLAVASSLREGLPVNIMEAMSCGKPVIASDNRGHRELIEDGVNGFLVNGNNELDFERKLILLYSRKDLQKQFSTSARLEMKKYKVESVKAELENVYNCFSINGGSKVGYPIRILHTVVNMNRGGAETLIMNLYRNIDRTMIQFDFLVHKDKPGDFEKEIESLGGKIYRLPYITEVGHFKYFAILRDFFRKHSYYNIVHSHMDCISGLVLKAAMKAGVPVRIAHSHNTQSEGKLIVRMYKKYIGMKITSCATHLLACSQQAARWLFKAQAGRASIVRNGVEAKRFSYNTHIRNSIRAQLGIENDTLVVGHIGRFYHQKNHSFLIDIFSQVNKRNSNSLLLLVGDGPLKDEIKKKVKKLNLDNSVIFLGVREDIPNLLQAMDVFVFPSYHEGLPVTLIEAQASGLKCIVSDVVSKEADIGKNLLAFRNIREPAEKWAEGAITTYDRAENLEAEIKKSGYDIVHTAKDMENYYKKCFSDLGIEQLNYTVVQSQ